jgi:uncharacterized protein YcbK (DUF882 family)
LTKVRRQTVGVSLHGHGAARGRRQVLLAAGCALCGAILWRPAAAEASSEMDPLLARLLQERRMLWLRRGKEEVRATYWTAARGRDQDEYLRLCWILRDVQADRVFAMNHALLDTLAGIQMWLKQSGTDAPINVHSGYRTRRTNLATEGAALNSRHLMGQAADISIEGITNVRLAGMSSVLGRGGTGFYVGRSWVHVDAGHERIWIDQQRAPAASSR